MGTDLGSTDDPKDLVPGDTGKLTALATALTGWSKKFDKVGDGLRELKIPGWTGQASDAFWPTLAKEKANWYLASDSMSGAAGAVTAYASTLSWAQKQALTAIHQWKSGDHSAAETTLAAARKQLKPEAEKLAKKLDELGGGGSHAPGWLADARGQAERWLWVKDHAAGKTSRNRWKWEQTQWLNQDGQERHVEKEWGHDENGNWFVRDKAGPETEGDDATPRRGGTNVEVKLAEWQGNADAWSAEGKGDWSLGDAKTKGSLGVSALGVDATAGSSFTNGRLQAGVSGSAYLAQASAGGDFAYGIVGAQGEAKVFAGADAAATVGVGKDGLHAGGEAFAGAKATGSVSADVGGVGAGVSGEAWAGVGASASLDLGMKDNKFTIGGDLGVGLGVGGRASFDVTVDPSKLMDSIDDAADWVGDGWDNTVGSLF
ncbi:hypothetical protein KUM39_04205 [Streptomyces sp. J2-1]|uniref:putative T7SS-secreted protein n=1 Tax=Streptomyces corallincola TaxID=2851888 RepID=UPI001C38C6F1|nr:hypothetical protein [Streptomyces corallincola]MBV2353567.1 hypothetical protein [Streptomyces corallincola]